MPTRCTPNTYGYIQLNINHELCMLSNRMSVSFHGTYRANKHRMCISASQQTKRSKNKAKSSHQEEAVASI
jgi:hypothetical protein